jgi:hypothetical protein
MATAGAVVVCFAGFSSILSSPEAARPRVLGSAETIVDCVDWSNDDDDKRLNVGLYAV